MVKPRSLLQHHKPKSVKAGKRERAKSILAILQSRGIKIRGKGGWHPEVLAKMQRKGMPKHNPGKKRGA